MTAKIDTEILERREFITALYDGLLDRTPDELGLIGYLRLMNEGASKVEIIQSIVNSDEFRQKKIAAYAAEAGITLNPKPSRFANYAPPPSEASRCYHVRLQSGFLDRYCSGDCVLDVGFSGYDNPDRLTALPHAIGIDLDYPGYDGKRLPFEDGSVDTIFSSHCLEHVVDEQAVIQDWFRVLKIGGFIVCMVPHQALYEKKTGLPSDWNMDHKRMYMPGSLIAAFETALEVNTYRLRHLADNDLGFNYGIGPGNHSDGAYEIEMVIEKIQPPTWKLAEPLQSPA